MTANGAILPQFPNHPERGANHFERRKPRVRTGLNGVNGFFLFLAIVNIQGCSYRKKEYIYKMRWNTCSPVQNQ